MEGWGHEFRTWSLSLDDARLRRLLTRHGCLRHRRCDHRKGAGAAQSASRQEVQSARVWLAKAKEARLADVALCAVARAAGLLATEYGFPEDVLREPSENQLLTMFEVLDPELARCAMYGLMLPQAGRMPAAAMAARSPRSLLRAADREPPPDAHEIGPALARSEREARGTPEKEPGEPRTVTDPDEKTKVATMTSLAEQEPEAGPDGQVDALRKATAQLRSAGVVLAQTLADTAEAVREGRHCDADSRVADGLADWRRRRSLLADQVIEAGGIWSEEQGFTDLAGELDRLAAEARQENRRRLDELRQQTDQLRKMLTGPAGQIAAAQLEEALDQLLTQIAALEADQEETTPSSPGLEPSRGSGPGADSSPGRRSGPEAQGRTLGEHVGESGQRDDAPGAVTASAPPAPRVATAGERAATTPAASADPASEAMAPAHAEDEPAPVPECVSVPETTLEPKPALLPETTPEPGQEYGGESAEQQPAPPGVGASGPATSDADAHRSTSGISDTEGVPSVEEPWPDGVERADWDPAAPWETGGRPPVARLVSEGRLPQAYWMTAASQEPAVRSQALAFAAAAFACVGGDEATQVQMGHDLTPQRVVEDREAGIVATVAALRSGLSAGWPHALVTDFSQPTGLSTPWQQLLTVLVTAVRDCRTFVPGAIDDLADPGDSLTPGDLGESARVLLEDLPRRKIKYQRASRVLQYLAGPSGELHRALGAVLDWAQGTGGDAPLAVLSDDLRRPEHVDRIIEEADSRFRTPKQAKEPIHSGALRQLHAVTRSVGELLAKADAMAKATRSRDAAKRTDLPQLGAVIGELESYEPPPGVGGAALGLLRDWLVGRFTGESGAPTAEQSAPGVPSADCLLLAPHLPRDTDGRPDLDDPRVPRAMAALLAPASPDEALDLYLDSGDLHLARALISWLERHPAQGAAPTDDWCEQATRRCREAEKGWRSRTAERHRKAAGLLAQIRTLNLMAPDVEREFTGRLQEFADGDEAGRYRYALAGLARLVDDLGGEVRASTERLRQDLDDLRLDPERPLAQNDHDRILALIEEGDTVTAQEFLALVSGGDKLPDRSEDDGAELVEFVEGLTGPGVPQPGGEGVHASWWVRGFGSGERLTSAAEQALESWQALCTKRGRSSEWQQHIPRVLRLLGLEPTGPLNSDRPGLGVRRLKVRATVAEGAGYVAALGSRATSYTILLIWEEQRAGGPLNHLEDADVDANIVLYLHPLGLSGRRSLAEAASGLAQQALVVDPAVFGWMVTRAPRQFRALQRVTLPWASYNPYTPFVAGLVPAEVFYGRDDEMREVMDPNGGLFLYGGRQLGKSALLQRVAELFPSRSTSNFAVYLDLLKAEIGQAEPPEQIWSLLAEGLKRRGVFDAKMSERGGPDAIAKRIRDWLDEDDSRRLLILADEADAFLTADSRRVFRSGGESTFQNVKRLQQLMEQTRRRLKVVFAGLHQVQRFGELSNVSTAHGGPDVLVGPLKPHAAVRLVTEPMAALGFVFDRPELVWRILAITNYQANLVQIFCSELVRTLQDRSQQEPERPTRITEDDVQGVAASETVRRRLAERLRFTINLEDRYRVLTLVIALRSLADGYRGDYTAEELLGLAREAWPKGFDELGVKRVEIYLTEMVGLGLLVQLGDRSRFAVRSPNVVNMLGTREELGLELRESEFSLPYDYDPRAARRLLGRDPAGGIQRYSPLTEGQLHEAAMPGVTVIGTTDLHRPPMMLKAAEAFAEARGVEVHRIADSDGLRARLKETSRLRKNYVLMADLRSLRDGELSAAVQACAEHAGPAADLRVRSTERKRYGNRSVFLLTDAVEAGVLEAAREGTGLPVRFLRPERWTADSLRAWPECPFVSRAERGRLIEVTGGWAPWVELAIAEVAVRGATLNSSLDTVRHRIAQPANLVTHWERSGLDAQDEERLGLWCSYVDEGQGVPLDDVAAAVELSMEDTGSWLDRLDRLGILESVPGSEARDGTPLPGGLAIDPVTFRAVRARAEGA